MEGRGEKGEMRGGIGEERREERRVEGRKGVRPLP